MIRYFYLFLPVLLVFLLLPQCKKDLPEPENGNNDSSTVISAETKYINNWIWDAMNMVYYWNKYLPTDLNPDKEPDPEAFFNKLLYYEDNFSWIYDDYNELMGEYLGVTTSMGYSPTWGRFYNSNEVFIIVEYTYPGSPADRAGLKRGDIILSINNTDLTIDNYLDLYYLPSYTVTLGVYNDGYINKTNTTINMTAEEISLNPIIYKNTFIFGETKIGYLVYAEFKSGQNDVFNDSLGLIFDKFTAAGISDLIIDLRYNPGGDPDASGYMASGIAPLSVVQSHEILIQYDYNDSYDNYFLQQDGANSPNLVYRFPDNTHNLNLNRIFFLTTRGTASASELLISGLYPYMQVIQVGEATYGKYAGAWIIPDLADPPKHNWALIPVVFKYLNAQGLTDFKDGLQPTYVVDDDLLNAKPFGDTNDPVFRKALESIVGAGNLPSLKAAVEPVPYEKLENKYTIKKRNLFIIPELH